MKYNKPLVSIVIPVYNGSNYMKEAIDSALSQTYDNVEIIVVNDGSNDNGKTRNIALSYGDKIKYFEKDNGGVSTALNKALKEMNGDYFSWLSHDDRYYPDKIEKQINYLVEHNCKNVILYSNYDVMNEYSEVYSKVLLNHCELMEKPQYALLRGAINGITLLIPRDAFSKYGNFSETLRCTQDYDKWAEFIKSYTFVHQDLILATSRVHSMQTGNTSPKMLLEGNKFWIDYIESYNNKSKEKIDRTIFNYYYGFYNFIKQSPYEDTTSYVKNKLVELYKEFNFSDEKLEIMIDCNNINSQISLEDYINKLFEQTYKNISVTLIGYNEKIKCNNFNNIKTVSSSLVDTINKSDSDYICIINNFCFNESNRFEKQIKFMQLVNSNICFLSAECQELSKNDFLLYFYNDRVKLDSIIINNNYMKRNKIIIKDDFDALFNFIIQFNTTDIDFLSEKLIKYNYDSKIENKLFLYKNRLKNVLETSYANNNELIKALSEDVYIEINNLYNKKYNNNNNNRNYILILRKKGIRYCMKRLYEKVVKGKK